MIYRWKDNTPSMYMSFNPITVGTELMKLSSKNKGRLTSTVVLAAAKNVESPLHGLFIWNDSQAAMMYRKVQAREIARCIVVVKTDTPQGNAEGKPMFSHVQVHHSTGERHHGYINTGSGRRDPDYRGQMVETAIRQLRDWYDKYWDLSEIAELITAIEENWPKDEGRLPEKKHVGTSA